MSALCMSIKVMQIMIKGIRSILAAMLCVAAFGAVAEPNAQMDVIENPCTIPPSNVAHIGQVLKMCTVSLYRETSNDVTPEDAGLLGSGVFAAKFVNGEKRYFIITANHLIDSILFGDGSTGFQVGLISQNALSIKRLSIVPCIKIHLYSDLDNDLAIIDITDIISDLERTGGSVVAIDLDPSSRAQWDPASRTVPLVAPLMDCSRIILKENAQPLALVSAAKPSLSKLVSSEGEDWAVPFVISEGRLRSQDISADIQFSDYTLGRKQTYQVSFVEVEDCWPGMSGSAVYILGRKHIPLLYGIVIAGNTNGLDVIPIAKAVKLIDAKVSIPIKVIPKNQ